MEVTARQVLAFRVARHGLAIRAGDPIAVLQSLGVQDSPPGAATTALVARLGEVPVGWLDTAVQTDRSVVSMYNARTATSIVATDAAALLGTALLPDDDAGYRALLLQAIPGRKDDLAAPIDLAVDAISSALDGRSLGRDALHEELRNRLPEELLPWCEGCQSHHARRGLLVMVSLRGRLCLSGREGRQPVFTRTDQWSGWDPPKTAEAQAELVRRYLSALGPSSPGEFAAWAGLGKPHARVLWDRVAEELTEVRVDGGPPRWLLADDADGLATPPDAKGVRLLGPGDPLLMGRDREVLVADAAVRKRLWTAIPTTGLVLMDGAPAALWNARKKGKRLELVADAFATVNQDDLVAEAERLALHRGCTSAGVSMA